MKKTVRTVLIVVIVLAIAGFGISRLRIEPAKNTPAERGEAYTLAAEGNGEASAEADASPTDAAEEEAAPTETGETEQAAPEEPEPEAEAVPEQPEDEPAEAPAPEPESEPEAEATEPEQAEEPEAEPQKIEVEEASQEPEPEPEPEPEEPEPEPEAQPEPELLTEPPEPEKHVCTIEISCWTVAEDLSKLENEAVLPFIPEDGVILPKTEMEFTPGETVADILDRATWENDIQIEHRPEAGYGGMYVLGINYLYAMDAGSESGWMYHVNGQFPNYGCSRYEVQDGDAIVWVYTCDLGRDVGDNSVW